LTLGMVCGGFCCLLSRVRGKCRVVRLARLSGCGRYIEVFPTLQRTPDSVCCATWIVDNRPIAEPQDLPAGVGEVVVLAAVPLELIAVETVCRPPVALDEHCRPSETEVHLPTGDSFVERDGWKPMTSDEFDKDDFENRVGGSMIDRPCIDGSTERRYAGPAAAAVLDHGCGECVEVEEAATECRPDSRFDERWVVGSEVAEGAERVRAADSVATLGCELLTVGRPMYDDTGQAWAPISFRDGEVSECICRLDQIPEHGR
jgi:hypothetical protein